MKRERLGIRETREMRSEKEREIRGTGNSEEMKRETEKERNLVAEAGRTQEPGGGKVW